MHGARCAPHKPQTAWQTAENDGNSQHSSGSSVWVACNWTSLEARVTTPPIAFCMKSWVCKANCDFLSIVGALWQEPACGLVILQARVPICTSVLSKFIWFQACSYLHRHPACTFYAYSYYHHSWTLFYLQHVKAKRLRKNEKAIKKSNLETNLKRTMTLNPSIHPSNFFW